MKQLVIFVLFTLSAGLLFAQVPEAVIKEMTGTVELKRSGSADWAAAQEGDRILRDTIVSTGFKSTVLLVVGNSTIMVRPLTRLSLTELLNMNETETININLTTGRIRVDIKPPTGSRANFTVQTPRATASVRGTTFEMNTVNIQVFNGAVHYQSASGTFVRPVIVTAGQQSWIDTATDGAVRPITAAEATRNLPNLPGQNAIPSSNNGAQLEVIGRNGVLAIDTTYEGGK